MRFASWRKDKTQNFTSPKHSSTRSTQRQSKPSVSQFIQQQRNQQRKIKEARDSAIMQTLNQNENWSNADGSLFDTNRKSWVDSGLNRTISSPSPKHLNIWLYIFNPFINDPLEKKNLICIL